jgi:hypothetical protein
MGFIIDLSIGVIASNLPELRMVNLVKVSGLPLTYSQVVLVDTSDISREKAIIHHGNHRSLISRQAKGCTELIGCLVI